MPGRRPKPVELKLLQGNAGKRITKAEIENRRRAAKGADSEEREPLAPSPGLSKRAREAWPAMAEALADLLGGLRPRHRMAMELLVEAYSDWTGLRAKLQRGGATYKTKTAAGAVIFRARPEAAQAADAWRRFRLMLIEVGLTPAAEGRIDGGGGGEEDAFEKFRRSHPK